MSEQLTSELEAAAAVEGVNMADVLAFPDTLRELLTWMMRTKRVQSSQLAAYLTVGPDPADKILHLLVEKGFIEPLPNEQEVYQVRVKLARQERAAGKIWQVFDS